MNIKKTDLVVIEEKINRVKGFIENMLETEQIRRYDLQIVSRDLINSPPRVLGGLLERVCARDKQDICDFIAKYFSSIVSEDDFKRSKYIIWQYQELIRTLEQVIELLKL